LEGIYVPQSDAFVHAAGCDYFSIGRDREGMNAIPMGILDIFIDEKSIPAV
jgi:hypothetical protein